MTTWQSIQTRGFIKVTSLILMTSMTTMGSSIASPIPPTASPTLEESTSCRSENQKEESVESQASQTGSSITEVLTSLNQTLEEMARILSDGRSSPSTQPSEEQTMRRQDNSF